MGYRYIGAKNRLNDQILDSIKNIKGENGHIVDLMSGTGQVSLALREAGYQVTAIDVMTYSCHHAKVLLFLTAPPLFQHLINQPEIKELKSNGGLLFEITNYEAVLNYLNSIAPINGFFWQEYSPEGKPENSDEPRKYFTAYNAGKIDAIRTKIKEWNNSGQTTELEHSLLIHNLIMATNDVANIAGTYGHYLSKFVKRAEEKISLTPISFSSKGLTTRHKVIQGYAEHVAESIEADLCYIDPPYIKRQYAANYHILETIARGDKPYAIGVSGLRPWRDQYSNFCSKVKIRDSFRQIFSKMKCIDFLISYSEDGLLSIDVLTDLFSEFGSVITHEIKYKRFKSNNSKLGEYLYEYLIHLHKTTHQFDPEHSPQLSVHAQDAK